MRSKQKSDIRNIENSQNIQDIQNIENIDNKHNKHNTQNTVAMKEFMLWLNCPLRLYYEQTVQDYDNSELSEIIIDLQARAGAGLLSSDEVDELRVFEALLNQRQSIDGNHAGDAKEVIMDTGFIKLAAPVKGLLIKSFASALLLSFLVYLVLTLF
jgi:hypothetical protein